MILAVSKNDDEGKRKMPSVEVETVNKTGRSHLNVQVRKCHYIDCDSTSLNGIDLKCAPKASSINNAERRRQWLINMGLPADDERTDIRCCVKHFDIKFFYGNGKLIKDAVPKPWMPALPTRNLDPDVEDVNPIGESLDCSIRKTFDAVDGPLRGLVNMGNSCYINSLCQAWFACSWIWMLLNNHKEESCQLLKSKSCIICLLKEVGREVTKTCAEPFTPLDLLTQIWSTKDFDEGLQQDSMELHRMLLEKIESLDKKGVSEVFEGKEVFERQCLVCGKTRYLSQPMYDLCLPMASDLKEALRIYMNSDDSCVHEPYCSHCHRGTPQKEIIYFQELPKVLVIQLKR
ncbi:ubiquitin carboxyl-terminal hydrolase 12-like isoform X2 [Neocloeon triangulifer]|uniref:ubiquitin carboxyl-terminal hydrolase 12-like isoform X2 n=1 Tax=Neocloeon triangulifer TaxID=2078957 RepID=UPI00286F7252|nr:ubiquitin carboxyl-terminal hydrolase 12-like isoform X2 [Neocloeon triangulifer]XP_059490505.1 ubiquitin carboxyl-terminal hydrolase 12-like isoform X2 [Neocloeon triangulifer]